MIYLQYSIWLWVVSTRCPKYWGKNHGKNMAAFMVIKYDKFMDIFHEEMMISIGKTRPGKRLHNYIKSPSFMRKLTNFRLGHGFNSYVKSTEVRTCFSFSSSLMFHSVQYEHTFTIFWTNVQATYYQSIHYESTANSGISWNLPH